MHDVDTLWRTKWPTIQKAVLYCRSPAVLTLTSDSDSGSSYLHTDLTLSPTYWLLAPNEEKSTRFFPGGGGTKHHGEECATPAVGE